MSHWWFKSPWRLGYSFSYEEQLINECVFHYCFVTVVSIYCKLIKCCTLVFVDQHIKSINLRIWLLLIPIVDRGENQLERARQVTKVTEWAEDGNEIWRSEVRIWLYQRVLPYNFSHFLFWTPCQEGGRSQPPAGLAPGSVPNRGTCIVPRSIWSGRLGSLCQLPALASSEMFIILPNPCTSIHIGSCWGFPAFAWGDLVPVSAGSWLKAQESLGGFPSTRLLLPLSLQSPLSLGPTLIPSTGLARQKS